MKQDNDNPIDNLSKSSLALLLLLTPILIFLDWLKINSPWIAFFIFKWVVIILGFCVIILAHVIPILWITGALNG